jgi:hypothetical protein
MVEKIKKFNIKFSKLSPSSSTGEMAREGGVKE